MFKIGGGGNDPEFLRWLIVRMVAAGLAGAAWWAIAYYPRKLLHQLKKLRQHRN